MRWEDRHTDPKSPAGHEMRIDRLEKKPQRSAMGEWAGISFENQTVPGDSVLRDYVFDSDPDTESAFLYASPFDGTVYSLNLSDHKLYLEEDGVYEFQFGWFFVGSGTITNANAIIAVPTQQEVADLQVMGQARGSLKAQGLHIRTQSYPSDFVAFPQPVYISAYQNSGVDMQLHGEIVVKRISETPHDGSAEVYPDSSFIA